MADMAIDDATLDAQVTGAELLPASDGGNPRAVSTEKIKDYVLSQIAALTAASGVDASQDGVYLLKGGELKPVSASVLAAAVLDYAFALASIVDPNGNEKLSVKDGNTKKSITLDQIKDYVLEGVTYGDDLTEVLAGKVDKVTGKGLSTEDYTTEEKTKLAGIEAGAKANVKPDWNAAAGTVAEILNKPTITSVTVDSELSPSSQNPVSNDVIKAKFDEVEEDIEDIDETVSDHETRLDAIDDSSTGALKVISDEVSSKVPLVAVKEGPVNANATCALHVVGHDGAYTNGDGGTVKVNFGTEANPDYRVLFVTGNSTGADNDGLPMRFMIYDDPENPLDFDSAEHTFSNLSGLHPPLMVLYDVYSSQIYINQKASYEAADYWIVLVPQ